jgi:hypothetical protein
MKANARFSQHRRRRAGRVFRHKRLRHHKKEIGATAPSVFSFIQNPDGMAAFVREVRSAADSRNIFVDLSGVTTMTPDAIAGLLATIHHCKLVGARVRGNSPADPRSAQMLNDSGFRAYVYNAPGARFQATMGKIERFKKSGEAFQDRYDQALAQSLIEVATLKLTGRPQSHGASFSVFGEAMLNTLNHAARSGEPHEPWWASVYYDSERQRACFTFLDQGVGIFRSHRLTVMLKILKGLQLLSPAELLERLFKGQIPSTTRLPGRGNGIPWMYDTCKAGRIRNLTILSNKAIGNAETDLYSVLSNSFDGTLLYWEI